MKARDVLAKRRDRVTGRPVGEKEADAILDALLSAPEPVRLELARALVKAEGWRVVKVPDAKRGDDDLSAYSQGREVGWNACRAATLASEVP